MAEIDTPFKDVAHHQLIEHPAPWKIEEDWTYEIYASDGALVAKPSSLKNAVALVEWAARETKEMDETIAEMEREADKDPALLDRLKGDKTDD